jgi:hypothetical protein
MSIEIIKNKKPTLKMPSFSVDTELHNRLNEFEITKLMNKSNTTLFLGKAGSGKTSLMTSFLKTPHLFKKIFHQIFVWMPSTSRSSMKDSFFDKYLPPNQLFNELTLENLQSAYDEAKENKKENYKTLFIFDDVQKDLKGDCEKLILEIINNRRHIFLNLFFCCQNYGEIPKKVRSGLTDLFVFNASKDEMEKIFEEQFKLHKNKFLDILKHCFLEPHSFLYINTNSQRIFSNWDEISIHDNKEE